MTLSIQDALKDLVQHTHGIGVISMLKIAGTSEKTTINAYDQEKRSVILNAEFKEPIAEFIGEFGMANLDRLSTILNIPVYKDGAKISVQTQKDNDGNDVPSGVNFVSSQGDFKNNYRFLSASVINDKLKSVTMKNVPWQIEFVPTQLNIQKLKFQTSAHADATKFSSKVEDGVLVFSFGDHSSHAGSFEFASDVGFSSKQQEWPLAVINTVLSLNGDKTFKISDAGVAEITVDSGLVVYRYLIPAVL